MARLWYSPFHITDSHNGLSFPSSSWHYLPSFVLFLSIFWLCHLGLQLFALPAQLPKATNLIFFFFILHWNPDLPFSISPVVLYHLLYLLLPNYFFLLPTHSGCYPFQSLCQVSRTFIFIFIVLIASFIHLFTSPFVLFYLFFRRLFLFIPPSFHSTCICYTSLFLKYSLFPYYITFLLHFSFSPFISHSYFLSFPSQLIYISFLYTFIHQDLTCLVFLFHCLWISSYLIYKKYILQHCYTGLQKLHSAAALYWFT